ncbi:hypothetical protein DL93DRAFT_2167781 [Clavulina sp. PMI_390]|nr:hypothetical protein DL93DRAFT_2167781 [Clavulina sp. PMI_390]
MAMDIWFGDTMAAMGILAMISVFYFLGRYPHYQGRDPGRELISILLDPRTDAHNLSIPTLYADAPSQNITFSRSSVFSAAVEDNTLVLNEPAFVLLLQGSLKIGNHCILASDKIGGSVVYARNKREIVEPAMIVSSALYKVAPSYVISRRTGYAVPSPKVWTFDHLDAHEIRRAITAFKLDMKPGEVRLVEFSAVPDDSGILAELDFTMASAVVTAPLISHCYCYHVGEAKNSTAAALYVTFNNITSQLLQPLSFSSSLNSPRSSAAPAPATFSIYSVTDMSHKVAEHLRFEAARLEARHNKAVNTQTAPNAESQEETPNYVPMLNGPLTQMTDEQRRYDAFFLRMEAALYPATGTTIVNLAGDESTSRGWWSWAAGDPSVHAENKASLPNGLGVLRRWCVVLKRES